ncbi:MAG: hypothetical protein M1831_001570 [Alyxoria varia]|nr:MAG: hypothetical protein M1831_001570 [Alyxoria varia]
MENVESTTMMNDIAHEPEANMARETTRPHLMNFALEIRQTIFDMVFEDTILKATAPRVDYEELDPSKGLSKIEPVALCLVSKQAYAETRTRYHGRVTYAFPSCFSFIDVLSQWNADKIRALKNVYLRATPLVFPAPLRAMYSVDFEGEMMLKIGPTLELFSPELKIEDLSIEDAIQSESRGFPRENQDISASIQIQSVMLNGCWTKYMEYISPPMEDSFTIMPAAHAQLLFARSFCFDIIDRQKLEEHHQHMRQLPDGDFDKAVARSMEARYRAWRDESVDYMARKVGVPEEPQHVLDTVRTYVKQDLWPELRHDYNLILPRSTIVTADPAEFPAYLGKHMRNGGIKVKEDDSTPLPGRTTYNTGNVGMHDHCSCCG